MAALKSGFSVELDLEREGRANETTMGELELFIVNPTCAATVWAGSFGDACRSISPHGTCPRSTCTPIPTAT